MLDSLNESAINLEGIYRELLQVVEARIARAKVVDRQPDPKSLEGVKLLAIAPIGSLTRLLSVISSVRLTGASPLSRNAVPISLTSAV